MTESSLSLCVGKVVNRKQYKSVRDALDTGSFSWRPSERPNARSFHRLKLYFDELVVRLQRYPIPSCGMCH